MGGRCQEAQNRVVAAQASLHKALVLLLEAMHLEESLRTEPYREQVESILGRLGGYPLPDDLQARVAGYRKAMDGE